ncbi:hypothetical protein Tco_0339620, partial [Tanacetum coccineum]
AKDKVGLGYDSPINDRFKTGEGFHAVPPPYTRNYMPSRPDLSFTGLDNSFYKTKVSENETSISKTSKDIVEKPKIVRPSAPILEEWNTNSDINSVFRPKSDQTTPKFTKIDFVKSGKNVNSVNKENTHRHVQYPRKSQSPRDNRRNYNGMMTQKLGNGFKFIKKACFVYGMVIGQREIRPVAFDHLRDALSVIIGLSLTQAVMSVDSTITYTCVHSEARSWSIPSEDPYEEATRQLLEQAPHSPEYVPDPMELEDYVPVYIPEPGHSEDLVLAEDEAHIEAYITEVASAPTPPLLPPSFLPSLIRPLCTRAAMAQMRAAAPSTYHPLLPSGTPPLLPIPLPAPSTSRRADIPEADTPPRKRLLLARRPRCEVGESFTAAVRQPGPNMARRVDYSFVDTVETRKDRAAVRAEIEILRRDRLAYEQESIKTRQALARSEAYSRALEARIIVLETQTRRLKWQRQDADDRATRNIMYIQALEARARETP